MPVSCSTPRPRRRGRGRPSWRADRLTTRRAAAPSGRGRASAACAAAPRRAPSVPIGTISPVSSATAGTRRAEQARARGAPAHQRLGADDARRSEVDDRLVVEHELVALDAPGAAPARCRAAPRPDAHGPRRTARRGRGRGPWPGTWRRRRRAAAPRAVSSPTASATPIDRREHGLDLPVSPMPDEMTKRPPTSLRMRSAISMTSLGALHVGQDHDELVAAEAGRPVLRTDDRPQALGDLHEQACRPTGDPGCR